MNDLQEVQKKSFGLKNLNTLYPGDIKGIYKNERSFYRIGKNTYEKRAFLYLDIISWLESKIENRRISDIMEKKNE
jgi:hypothetical protein